MGLKEPEVFVQFAGKLGKEIGSNGVAEVGGFLDGGAHGVRVMRDVMDQELEHRRTIRSGEIGFIQGGLGGRFPGSSVGDAAECGDAFGDSVRLVQKMTGD